mgnify:CR=1 FL=1
MTNSLVTLTYFCILVRHEIRNQILYCFLICSHIPVFCFVLDVLYFIQEISIAQHAMYMLIHSFIMEMDFEKIITNCQKN